MTPAPATRAGQAGPVVAAAESNRGYGATGLATRPSLAKDCAE
jgi:hypothetical protein